MFRCKRWIAILLCSMLGANSFTAYAAEPVEQVVETTEQNEEAGINEEVLQETDDYNELLLSAKEALADILAEKYVIGTIYLADYVEVKGILQESSNSIAVLESGNQVFIKDVEVWNSNVWLKIEFAINENTYQGYIPFINIAYSDETYDAWVQEYIIKLEKILGQENLIVARAGTDADIAQFPTSYQNYLKYLKTQHPNWTFVKFNTNLEWNDVVSAQMQGNRSYVYVTCPAEWKGSATGEKNWYLATEGALKYVLDPRNALEEDKIFQFEQLTYNASYHTSDAVQHILNNSFMTGGLPGTDMTYAQAFYSIGSQMGVSPFHLACRVYQEQGSEGSSALISGTYSGYENLYNYFNIGASGSSTQEVIINGLSRARQENWTSHWASLQGGAKIISKNYILKGQDTLYLQKFDVDSSYNGLYYHQYMQNIQAPISEGKKVRNAYIKAGAINNKFVFKIPVYNNMPASTCVDPSTGVGNTVVNMEQIEAFVERLYTTALGRTPDEVGMSTWPTILANGEMTGAEVAYGFIFSNEFMNRGFTDSEYIEVLYKTFMNRTSDPGGKQTWMKALESGVSRAGVFKGFVESAEFNQICNSYGIIAGGYEPQEARDVNANLTMFVSRMYTKALGRTYDVSGLNDWCGWMLEGKQTPESTASGFIFSSEMINKNLANEEFVKVMYRVFLDREYDEPGLKTWVDLLETGTSRNEVMHGFAASAEFAELVKSYGL